MAIIVALTLVAAWPSSASASDIKETTTHLNLRSTPSADSRSTVIRVLPPGTRVSILENRGGWSRVRIDGSRSEGWVSRRYLKSPSIFQVPDLSISFTPRNPFSMERSVMRSKFLISNQSTMRNLLLLFTVIFVFAFYWGLSTLIADSMNIEPGRVFGIVALLVLFSGLVSGWKLFMIGFLLSAMAFAGIAAFLNGFAVGSSLQTTNILGGAFGIVSIVSDTADMIVPGVVFELRLGTGIFAVLGILAVSSEIEDRLLRNFPAVFAATYNPVVVVVLLGGALVFASAISPVLVVFHPILVILGIIAGYKS